MGHVQLKIQAKNKLAPHGRHRRKNVFAPWQMAKKVSALWLSGISIIHDGNAHPKGWSKGPESPTRFSRVIVGFELEHVKLCSHTQRFLFFKWAGYLFNIFNIGLALNQGNSNSANLLSKSYQCQPVWKT